MFFLGNFVIIASMASHDYTLNLKSIPAGKKCASINLLSYPGR